MEVLLVACAFRDRSLRRLVPQRGYSSRVEERLPGVGRVLDQEVPGVSPGELVDAVALMWTARRLLVRAGTRLPADPEWDGRGLRMEIWR